MSRFCAASRSESIIARRGGQRVDVRVEFVGGTDSSAKPIRAASTPLMLSPLNSMRLAHCGPTW